MQFDGQVLVCNSVADALTCVNALLANIPSPYMPGHKPIGTYSSECFVIKSVSVRIDLILGLF